MLTSTLITAPAELRQLRSKWEDLVGRSADVELMLHPRWLLAWWDVFGQADGRRPRVVAFRDGPLLVGLAPLLARRHFYKPGIPFRRLEPIGSGEDEAEETCADYLGLVAERGREPEVASAFAEALASGRLGSWDELVVPSMNGESRTPRVWADALERRGLDVVLEEYEVSPYIPLPKTFDDYLAALSSSKRSQLKKALKNFESWAGGPPVIHRVTRPEQLAEGKRILIALHGARWGGDGAFAAPRFREFHDRMMVELLAAGALDLGWLSVRGEPVAAFYNFRHDGRLLYYQGGRRVDIPEAVRVGITMHAYIIRSAIESGMREYDFLAGASQYKMALALAKRPLLRLRAARRSLVEIARRESRRRFEQWRKIRAQAEPRLAPMLEKLRARRSERR